MPSLETPEERSKWRTAHAMHRDGCPLADTTLVSSDPGFPGWDKCTCD